MKFERAAEQIVNNGPILVSTGAGISVESGIPSFRGPGGLWEKHDPIYFDLDYFKENPKHCWEKIREIFYQGWKLYQPNEAHYTLSEMQNCGLIHTLVTQNIDGLHQKAGSDAVEFHGSLSRVKCMACAFSTEATDDVVMQELPRCPVCGAVLKPEVVFFKEDIPAYAYRRAFAAAQEVKTVLVIGTSGTVQPACLIPDVAKQCGAKIIEVNLEPSEFSRKGITDIYLSGQSSAVMRKLWKAIRNCQK